jgi:predicted MFS family arabinose efflux permease
MSLQNTAPTDELVPTKLQPQTTDRYSSPKYQYYVLFILTIVYTFNFVDRQLLAILAEPIKQDLSLSDTQLGLLTGFSFAIFYVVAGIPIARWADKSNRRNIISVAIGLWSLMTAVSGFAQNYVQLLLARIGVGIGEAGGSPPAHSMISDIFPVEKRATALATYSTGVNIGVMLGFLLGGILNEYFGWRVAFFVVGLPGILVALVLRFTVQEPTRGFSDKQVILEDSPPLMDVVKLLWSRKSFRHLSFAAALSAMLSYGSTAWVAPYFIRIHHLGTAELGLMLALVAGLAGAVGTFSAGFLSDRLGRSDKRWYLWIPGICKLSLVPAVLFIYSTDHAYAALWVYIIPGFLSSTYIGPAIAMLHGLVSSRMRALASAILFFIINLIGLGIGPWLVGAISDATLPTYGVESLRYALLMVVPIAGIWSSIHFFLAARYIRGDLEKAP